MIIGNRFSLCVASFLAVSLLSLPSVAQAERKTEPEEETSTEEIIDYKALMFEAADRREGDNLIFEEALKAGHLEALWHLGQIGTRATCQRLSRYLSFAQNEVRLYAASGAAMCMQEAPVAAIALQVSREPDALIKGELYRALGMTGREDVRTLLIDAISSEKANATLEGALEGLLQNIVYAGLKSSDLSGLDYGELLKLARNNKTETTAYRAAYLLSRVSELNEVLALSDIISAYEKVKFESVKILLVRLIARLPVSEGQVAFLIARADDENAKFRYEAINGLVQTGTDSTKVKLLDILGSADRSIADKQAVLSALGTKHTGNKDVAQVVKNYSQDENRWLAVRALQAGIMADAEFYEGLADEWLKSDDYYKAFQAMVALSRSDDGKAKLLDFAASSNNFVRAREARIAVDPSIEARSTPRVSPTYAEVSKSRSRITLKTTRGDIIMETHLSAPFTAYNFTALAKEGKMDGMLWHRVIPNFVAQAGQKEDKSLYEWGSVREEWAGGTHTVGSVGVATAGKDTGGTQFFINTQRNLHLDGRYTVFAHIVEGMDVVYSLEEGDLINKAIVEETPIDETE